MSTAKHGALTLLEVQPQSVLLQADKQSGIDRLGPLQLHPQPQPKRQAHLCPQGPALFSMGRPASQSSKAPHTATQEPQLWTQLAAP